MSTGIIGTIGSVATGQLQQGRTAEADRTSHEVSNQARRTESTQRAVDAAGIGQMEQEGEASERDADGRRLWERPAKSKGEPDDPKLVEATPPPLSKDPSGNAGNQIDLSG